MRMSQLVMSELTKKARRLRVTRTHYVEQLIRKDLNLPTLEMEAADGELFS